MNKRIKEQISLQLRDLECDLQDLLENIYSNEEIALAIQSRINQIRRLMEFVGE